MTRNLRKAAQRSELAKKVSSLLRAPSGGLDRRTGRVLARRLRTERKTRTPDYSMKRVLSVLARAVLLIACVVGSDASAQWAPVQPQGGYGTPAGGYNPAPSPAYVPPAPAFDAYNNPAAACPPLVAPQPLVTAPEQRFHLFGEYLYLRPNDAAMVSYALPVNGLLPPPAVAAPAGAVGIVDPGYSSGFSVGGGFTWNQGGSELLGAYTTYDSDASSALSVTPPSPNVISPLVLHPATLAAGSNFTSATGRGDVSFDLIDLEFRRAIAIEDWVRSSYHIGARYAKLDQGFYARFDGGVAPGPASQDVAAQVDFDGAGIRLGLSADLCSPRTGMFLYSNGFASFIAGEFQGTFTQTDATVAPIVTATTSRSDDRVVPILDIELGVGWQSRAGGLRLTAGYLFSAWFNVVGIDEFIRATHAAQYSGLADTMTFDGLSARADWRF